MVTTGHLDGQVPGAALGGLAVPARRTAAGPEEQPPSPRTASEQVISPGYLLTQLFELGKAPLFPSHGGTPKWCQRNRERAGACLFL